MTEQEEKRHESGEAVDGAENKDSGFEDWGATMPELPAFFVYAQEDAALADQIVQTEESMRGMMDPEDELSLNGELQKIRADAQESVADVMKIKEISEPDVIDLESPETPPEIRMAAADAGIALMRDVLNGIDDCVVFASTALYLQGIQRGITEFQVPPGDFDAAVTQEQTLRRIQERISNVPGATFENDGQWKKMGGEAQLLSGQIIMDIQTPHGEKRVAYPFEFFLNTFIADKRVLQYQENLSGLNVLTMEGLQNQYLNNLNFELRVGVNTETVAKFLLQPQVERQLQRFLDGETDPVVDKILQRLELTSDDVRKFYSIRNEMMSSLSASGESFEERMSDLAILLSGFKTKIPKRQKNVEQLQRASQIAEVSK